MNSKELILSKKESINHWIMKHLLAFALFFCITASVTAQIPDKVMDEKSQTIILVGATDPQFLTEGEFGISYVTEFANYLPDTLSTHQISNFLSAENGEIKITLVLGTWCGDSKEQVPRFYKINSLLTTKFNEIEIIGVDRLKKAGILDISGLKIEKVPTFIFYRNGIEIGRIVETPQNSIEKDILLIISPK